VLYRVDSEAVNVGFADPVGVCLDEGIDDVGAGRVVVVGVVLECRYVSELVFRGRVEVAHLSPPVVPVGVPQLCGHWPVGLPERRAVLHARQRVLGQPIEAQFGPVRTFVMGNSDHSDHTALARRLQDYLRWRNAHARDPDVLAAQRRERARIRSERQQRWGRPKPKAA
jgi:hypothetical protein